MHTLRIILFSFFVLFAFAKTTAQDVVLLKKTSRKVQNNYQKGELAVQAGRLTEAREYFDKVLEAEPNLMDAIIQQGNVAHDLGQLPRAEQYYQRAIALDSTYYPRLWYQLGLTQKKQARYKEAVQNFEAFLRSGDRNARMNANAEAHLRDARFAAVAVQHPVPFDPKPLSANINTAEPEYLPSFTADGQQLIYTAVRNGQEDFFYSKKENGEWLPGQPILEVNTRDNEGAQTISADGRTLVFTACNRRGGLGSCDLYLSYKRDGAWSPPQNMGSIVNSRGWESQPALSANGQLLFFASKREGGKGGSDIWLTYQQADGNWAPPSNLGSTVNTAGDDQAPFMHPDGRTLYFMSNGHPGMGGYDLYLTRLQDDGHWSTPENLGYPINTSGNEGALVVSLDGKTAYFSADKSTSGELIGPNTDILEFELPEAARPLPVTYLKAKVLDAQTDEVLQANAELLELEKSRAWYKGKTDEAGTFLICLPAGNDYALNVSKEGYLFHSEHFALQEKYSLSKPYELTIRLQRVPEPADYGKEIKAEPVVLKNVFFATASAELKPVSETELNKLYQLLTDQPRLHIQLNGHTDDVGQAEDNQRLSEARAKAVYQYLIDKGIDAGRLSYRGFGESQPIAPNDTAEGRQQNRRTEFVVLRH